MCSEYLDDYQEELDSFGKLSDYQGEKMDKGLRVRQLLPAVGRAVERILVDHHEEWSTQCSEDAMVQHLWYLIQRRTNARVAPWRLAQLYNVLVRQSAEGAGAPPAPAAPEDPEAGGQRGPAKVKRVKLNTGGNNRVQIRLKRPKAVPEPPPPQPRGAYEGLGDSESDPHSDHDQDPNYKG